MKNNDFMDFWDQGVQLISQHKHIGLLYVLESTGSSPGRQGFKMLVSAEGDMHGSIGGGIMEHKLVELAKSSLKQPQTDIKIKRQIHSKSVNQNQSGLICSGEQTVTLLTLTTNDLPTINELVDGLQRGEAGTLHISPSGLDYSKTKLDDHYSYTFTSETSWSYKETIGFKKYAYIIGGGHVSRALTHVLSDLEFHCTVIDNRESLHTLDHNTEAQQKLQLDYAQLEHHIPEGPDVYIFIMTFGYRSDLDVLRQVINKQVAFKGMMGSQTKVKQLITEMRSLGYTEAQLSSIHSPIGLAIHSRTPQEIAISVAAQIIQLQNKDLP